MTIVHERVAAAHAGHMGQVLRANRAMSAGIVLPFGSDKLFPEEVKLLEEARSESDALLDAQTERYRQSFLPGGCNVRYPGGAVVRKSFSKADIEIPPIPAPGSSGYERALRKAVLTPLYKSIRERLSEAAGATQAYAALADAPMPDLHDLDRRVVAKYFRRLSTWHRAKIIKTFREALGIDVSILLKEGPIRMALHDRVRENVLLIQSVPRRLRGELQTSFLSWMRENPFDRAALSKILLERYGVAGSRMQLIARDQTTKAIGAFTQLRQEQIGVTHYRWSASDDERVRPTHQANDRDVFAWEHPPALTGHPGEDINCRCVAVAIVQSSTFDPAVDLG